MPRIKHTPAAKSRSGPTQPEDRRTARQLLLRLRPEAITRLRELAAARGLPVSALVEEWINHAP